MCEGDRLELTCSGTANSQQWHVFAVNESLTGREVNILPTNTVQPSEITVNRVPFHFFISSTSPLTSTAVIDNVIADANGTRLICRHSIGMSTTQTINVVTNGKVL